MDDEVTLDSERKYVIVYSRPEDRPANATKQAGISWVNWGPTAHQGIIWRWMAVSDGWEMPDTTPNEINLPRTKSSWSGKNYDSTLIGMNNHKGALGWYQPQIHYMTTAEFEALGDKVKADNVPVWGGINNTRTTIPSRSMAIGPTVRYAHHSSELIMHSLPKGKNVIGIFSLNGRCVKKVLLNTTKGGGVQRVHMDDVGPGYYAVKIQTKSERGNSVVVRPFVK